MAARLDVERLMRDLTIDQLQNIHSNLCHQLHEKRDELRKMVGRRYRDVLDASDTIQRLTEIASEFEDTLKEVRNVTKNLLADDYVYIDINKEPIFKLGLLLRLENLLENHPADPLGDVFAFLLVENLYHETQNFKTENIDANLILQSLDDRLSYYRFALHGRLEQQLGNSTNWEEVAGILTAFAFLNQSNLAELLGVYLEARKKFIAKSLESSSTLISVIEMIKETAECVNDVFGKGRAIVSALDFVTASAWCPKSIIVAMFTCPSRYLQQLEAEVIRINSSYSQPYADGLSEVFVEVECTKWMEGFTEAFETHVKVMKSNEQQELKAAAPTSEENENMATTANEQQQFSATNPSSLLQMVDPRNSQLLASGAPQELYDAVSKNFNRLNGLLSNINRYM